MQDVQLVAKNPIPPAHTESPGSAVSWGAVFAGAVIAAAVSAMLLTGGSGLGFLSMSPWSNAAPPVAALAIGSIVWLLVSQIIAYGVGGFITGRLRTKWSDALPDEVYFRDTAHGFVMWAVSVIIGLVLIGATTTSLVSGGARAGASLAGSATAVVSQGVQAGSRGGLLDYFTDALLRPTDPATTPAQRDARPEVSRILARSMINGQVLDADRAYLVKLIAQRAGVDEASAQQRLTQIQTQFSQAVAQAEQKAKDAADEARKGLALFSIWAFVALLSGAFVASFSATIGGRIRDR
ncbi:hypothetical protein AB870_23435 (plasmid) [Pandoraea faecigallinarum]|uniref:Transmembrane protein n=1 Tax=Pandoraea faecigallinarum TaxID=656179 RepID=A0A0H3WZX2_9BURK|nr:hypothetical protein [Pandoraea faecigallinarum]AKM33190.1 hypothetical protein AB870_23435 [Pandoraea faecigallinarum]